jgi:hypothetical protein
VRERREGKREKEEGGGERESRENVCVCGVLELWE